MTVPSTAQYAARLEELDPALPLAVTLADGTRVCLIRNADAVYAVADRCPHRDFALSGGDVVEPCVLECPWHGARFDVRTGAVIQGPATDALRTFDTHISEGAVWIASSEAP